MRTKFIFHNKFLLKIEINSVLLQLTSIDFVFIITV